MATTATLKTYTVKDLGAMAKKMGLSGWSSMRKDQLIKALVRAAKAKARKKTAAKAKSTRRASTVSSRKVSAKKATNGQKVNGRKPKPARKSAPTSRKKAPASPKAARKIRKANSQREKDKDLSTYDTNGKKNGKSAGRDRIVLLVRDAYWLQACWEVSRQSVERARAAMAEHWHTAKPVLRVMEVESGTTTSTAERVSRDIETHGGVRNWYIDVKDPPGSYRVDLGYLSASGRFFAIARSNTVTSPRPGSSDAIDKNWTDIAENYEKVFAQSGGYEQTSGRSDLRDLFEERLRRPMGSPLVTRYGIGADRVLNRDHELPFEVDAEMIIYGTTKPDAHVTLSGEPVTIRPDGTFTVRLSMPDRRQVLPVVASSSDGVEQRTTVLAIERNTKVMEPKTHESAG